MKKFLSIFSLIAIMSLVTPAYAHNMHHGKMPGRQPYHNAVKSKVHYGQHYRHAPCRKHISTGATAGIAITSLLVGTILGASLDNHYHYHY